MNKSVSIKTNYLFSLAYQILSIIAPIITTPYISRVLGPEGVGIYSYTSSNVTYFTMFGVLGLGTYGQLTIAKAKDDKEKRSIIFCNLIFTRIVLHAISLLVFLGFIFIVTENKNIYIIQIITILASMLDVTWFFQGIEEFKDIAIKNIVIKLGTIAALFTLVRNENDVPVYVFINVISLLLSSIYFIPKVKKYIVYKKPEKTEIILHLKNGLLYFSPTIASVIISMLDKTMLGIISNSNTQNGYYAEAYKIVFIAITVFSSLNLVMRSRMAYISVNGTEKEIITKVKSSLRFVILLACPMTFGLCGIASVFVPGFLGESFRPSVLLFEIMSWWIIFKATSNCLLEQYILPIFTIKKYAFVAWIGAIVNFIFNLIFIPRFQALGAVIASLITELVIFVVVMHICKGIIHYSDVFISGWKYLVSSIIMFISLLMIKQMVSDNIVGIAILLLSGVLVYGLMTLALKDELLLSIITAILKKSR